MPYGLLTEGPAAVTPISLPAGRYKSIGFLADNGLQGVPPAQIRVAMAINDGTWVVQTVTVDSAVGQTVVAFPNPAGTVGLSIQRSDDGKAHVAWVVG
jgi:hypothetical protein